MLFISAALGASCRTDAVPWTPDEHRALADSAFRIVLADLGSAVPSFPRSTDPALGLATDVWQGWNFGGLTQHFAESDGARSRFQQAGKSVYEQLQELSREEVEAFWNRASARLDGENWSGPVLPDAANVVASYLLAHLAAMQFARLAAAPPDGSPEAFRRMLVFESIAQGLLADAHASGHLLVPRDDPFQSLHPVNNRRAHDHYSSEGVFVVNGRHQAWEAFGDGLLTWYARSYRQVLEASVTSLREVFVVYLSTGGSLPQGLRDWMASVSHAPPSDVIADWLDWKPGAAYYEGEGGLPALNFIPMPISATWSIRGSETDRHGIRIRREYPQFRESGYHDLRLLDAAERQLYPRSALPERFVPPELRVAGESVAAAADTNRDAASVEYVQTHRMNPDFAGLLTEFGMGVLSDDDETAPAVSARIGYGLAENILVATHLSVNAGITTSLDGDQVSPVSLTAGLNPGGLPLRIETGYATNTDDFLSTSAWLLAAAYDLTSESLGFTYIGVSVRVRYGVMWFDEVLHSLSLQIAFH